MAFLLFCTDVPSSSERTPDLSRVTPLEFDSMGQSISAACKIIGRGAIVWQIKGSQGFMMERGDIEAECRQRAGRLASLP